LGFLFREAHYLGQGLSNRLVGRVEFPDSCLDGIFRLQQFPMGGEQPVIACREPFQGLQVFGEQSRLAPLILGQEVLDGLLVLPGLADAVDKLGFQGVQPVRVLFGKETPGKQERLVDDISLLVGLLHQVQGGKIGARAQFPGKTQGHDVEKGGEPLGNLS